MSLAGEERKKIILDRLNCNGKVKTSELVETLQVSSETIRRYLEELERDNRLKRVYGGAIKTGYDQEEPSHLTREVAHADEKKRIARTAANLVQDNDVLLIDDGTTTMHMLPYLRSRKNLCLITISVAALNLLLEYQNQGLWSGDVYFLGGKVQARHFRSVGMHAERMMTDFFIDKSFLAIDGVQLEYGISSYDAEKALLARRFIENAKETIVLSDHSKIGVSTFYKVADLRETEIVVSDVHPPEEWANKLEATGVNWIVAE